MSRVRLELPENFIFSTELVVRVSDISYANHLSHDSMLSMIHEARVRFLQNYGFREFDIAGVGLIIADAVIQYRAEVFYGDSLQIDVGLQDFYKNGCDIFYRLQNTANETEVARAKTGVVFFDYDERHPVAIPHKFRDLFVPDGELSEQG
ncbi:MAG TPA: thioesterase [Gammaproteobacteria bacterium]|nr:thioesterase [Gammaproteobacteria bacterium]